MPWRKTTRTEIVHIVVTGYQKKKLPSKYYVFVIDVTWNNSERFEVYRRYSDFFSFQTMLKSLFPGAAGRKNPEERVIPQLPKRIFVGRSHVAKVAEARLEQINRYCKTLMSLDPTISGSAHVVGFFTPRTGDKQLPRLHLHRPASLHPPNIPLGSICEEYCALAEYVAEDASQVSFKPGDMVSVVSKDESGWWMCVVNGKSGWAPPSYLKPCNDKDDTDSESDEEYVGDIKSQKDKDSDDSGVGENSASEPSTPASSMKGFTVPEIDVEEYKAIDSYQADGPGQVSFEVGDIIHVLDKLEDGWWFVSNGGEEGWAPCSYLEGDKEEETITNLDIEKYYSVDDYQAEEDDEISFKRGVTVDVIQKSLDGWWLVKLDSLVGLAPATFLKKVETEDPVQDLGQRIFPTTSSSSSSTRTVQQPPRKQSVRARASLRNKRPTDSASSKYSISPLPTIPAEQPYLSSSSSQKQKTQDTGPLSDGTVSAGPLSTGPHSAGPLSVGLNNAGPLSAGPLSAGPLSAGPLSAGPLSAGPLSAGPLSAGPLSAGPLSAGPLSAGQHTTTGKHPVVSPRRINPQKQNRIKEESISPEPTDSDPEENYLNFSFQKFALQATTEKLQPHRNHKNESSVSEEGSSLGHGKPPVATPRKGKSVKQAEKVPYISMKSQSLEEFQPPLPPKPGVKTVTKKHSFEEPTRPQRPRKSEIIRAKEKAKAMSKKAPSVTIINEDSFETYSDTTSESNMSTKSAPSTERETKKRCHTTLSDEDKPKLLTPKQPQRIRRRSEGEERIKETMGDELASSLSTSVADTILKYIISSEDPGLKAALRNLITQDSECVSSLNADP